MKKLTFSIVVVFGVLLLVIILRNSGKQLGSAKSSTTAEPAQQSTNQALAVTENGAAAQIPANTASKYPRWEGGRGTDLSDPRWKIIHEREKVDRGWQGRMPIDFYGQVVDSDHQPVEGATIDFVWTDLSPNGSSRGTTKSDASGLFALRNAQGKNLGVEVTKEGYYTAKQDRYGFEYAAFYEESFHQPNPISPVVYRLRKKQEADPLIYREQELKVALASVSEIVLDTGARLKIELLSNPRPKQGEWSMRVTALNGALQTTVEEFPFSAPADDYHASLVLDDSTPKPPTWIELYGGGAFYLKSGSNYGRIEIQMISGKDWVRVMSWLNPKPGSRNLEFDPAKAIKPQP